MKMRVTQEMQQKLQQARCYIGDSANDVMQKALRKAARLRPDLATVEPGSTYRGGVVTVDVPEGMTDAEARKVLAWFLGQADIRPPRYTFTPKERAGVDYEVIGQE